MNIFQDMGAFYGNTDQAAANDSLLSIFQLAKQIRLRLGLKGYLLDNYLDLVFQGFNRGDVSDTLERGVQAAYDFQLHLLSDILKGKTPETPHPRYNQARKIYEQHPEISSFQEERTKTYLLMALTEKELMEHAISEYIASQEKFQLGQVEIVCLCELYDRISHLVGSSMLDELNERLRRRFQTCSMMSAFIQGFADDLLFQLTWRDPESSKQIFQLLLDHLPGDD